MNNTINIYTYTHTHREREGSAFIPSFYCASTDGGENIIRNAWLPCIRLGRMNFSIKDQFFDVYRIETAKKKSRSARRKHFDAQPHVLRPIHSESFVYVNAIQFGEQGVECGRTPSIKGDRGEMKILFLDFAGSHFCIDIIANGEIHRIEYDKTIVQGLDGTIRINLEENSVTWKSKVLPQYMRCISGWLDGNRDAYKWKLTSHIDFFEWGSFMPDPDEKECDVLHTLRLCFGSVDELTNFLLLLNSSKGAPR